MFDLYVVQGRSFCYFRASALLTWFVQIAPKPPSLTRVSVRAAHQFSWPSLFPVNEVRHVCICSLNPNSLPWVVQSRRGCREQHPGPWPLQELPLAKQGLDLPTDSSETHRQPFLDPLARDWSRRGMRPPSEDRPLVSHNHSFWLRV